MSCRGSIGQCTATAEFLEFQRRVVSMANVVWRLCLGRPSVSVWTSDSRFGAKIGKQTERPGIDISGSWSKNDTFHRPSRQEAPKSKGKNKKSIVGAIKEESSLANCVTQCYDPLLETVALGTTKWPKQDAAFFA